MSRLPMNGTRAGQAVRLVRAVGMMRRGVRSQRGQPVAQSSVQAPHSDARPLRSAATSGAIHSAAGYAAAQMLRFGGNLILTRLLFQEAFGLTALMGVFLQGLQLFSDIGIGPGIIQSARGDDRRFLDTAWTVQALRGLCLWLACCAGAVPFAAFYGQPEIAVALPIAGLSVLFGGLNSTKIFTANRHLALARLNVVEIGSQAIGLAVMLGWALVDRSFWALVAGGTATSIAKLLASHFVLPGTRNRLAWHGESARALFRFGRWIFFSTVLTFLVSQSDRLIFGKMIPLGLLGVYSIAAMIALLPATALAHVGFAVVFPVYSRIHNAGEPLAPVYARVRRPLLVLGGWMISGLIAGGPTIARLLYDDRWADAGWIIRWLAIGSWFAMLETTNGFALLARGRASWVAAANAGKLAGMLAMIPVGYMLAGFPGAVVGFAASDAFKYAVSATAAAHQGFKGWRQDVALTAMVAVASSIAWLAVRTAGSTSPGVLVLAAIVAVTVTLAWSPLGLSVLRTVRGRDPAEGAGEPEKAAA